MSEFFAFLYTFMSEFEIRRLRLAVTMCSILIALSRFMAEK